ncbi:MAG: methyltransferase domain-containing protein [Rhodospirillales bacterium]|nr:methyltransferase domain-containing protein [Rhodospirillales bacterium]
MWSDVVDLRDFYASDLGQTARRLIRIRLRALWPDLHGQTVLGLGFATPYLQPWRGEAERVLAAMPAAQGVLPWPSDGLSLSVLADETALPFPDLSIDRLLMIHVLESTEPVRALMREAWRVLKDSGRLLVVVPNRRGLWSRLERSPFANGRPYSAGQITRLLREALFTPLGRQTALFLPPTRSAMLRASAPAIERIGQRLFPGFGGVILLEATKQVYAPNLVGAVAPRRRPAIALPQGLRRAELRKN